MTHAMAAPGTIIAESFPTIDTEVSTYITGELSVCFFWGAIYILLFRVEIYLKKDTHCARVLVKGFSPRGTKIVLKFV